MSKQGKSSAEHRTEDLPATQQPNQSNETRAKTHRGQQTLNRKLLGYTAAASAALAAGTEASAAPLGKINQNITVLPGQTFDLDIDNDGSPDVQFGLRRNENINSGGFDVMDTRQLSSTTLMSRVGYYRYTRTYRSSNFTGSAYANKIGFPGRIATSGALRRVSSSQNIDANLLDSGAIAGGQLGYLFRSSRYNRNSSSVRYVKRYYSSTGFGTYTGTGTNTGTGGGRGAFISSMTTSTRFGGYSSGPYSSFRSYGNFLGTRGFLAVDFDDASSNTRYAWVDVELDSDFTQLVIHGWGYEAQSDTGILAGARTDLATWQAAYATSDLADVDGDGDTDGNDFLILQRYGAGGIGPLESASVPEPNSLLSLAMGAVGVAALRKRRKEKSDREV